MIEKIAFVASGGSLLCAWGAGAAQALQESGVQPDIFVGSSGSAGTVSYFACGEAERAAKLWREEVTNPRVLQKHPLRLDVDFVIDSMRKRFPFNEQLLRAKNIELYLAATDYKKVRTRFFSSHEDFDWYEVMRASMAVPFVYGRKVSLKGRLYFDGDIASSLEDSIAFAAQRGATTIYACDTRYEEPFLESVAKVGIWSLLGFDFLKAVIGLIKKQRRVSLPKNIEVIYLKPAHALAAQSLDADLESIEEAVNSGYAETKEKLLAMLS